MNMPSDDPVPSHPALAASVARRREALSLRAADAITRFAGSMAFVAIHLAWFGAWIVANLAGITFDPYPFGLLTMVVSLEAIFLSTFVLISQNRADERHQAVTEHHYAETSLLEQLLRENTRLTEEVHALTERIHRVVAQD